MGSRILFASLLLACGACGNDDLLQGDYYQPDNALPPPEGTRHPDGGTVDGGALDPRPLPIAEGDVVPSNTCETARPIGTVSGDTGSSVVTAEGSCSEWLSVRLTEDDNGISGKPMRARIVLTPRDANFDLYVYHDTLRDVRSCATPFAVSKHAATDVETVALTWGDGTVPNGGEDDRTIGLAVIRANGRCGSGSFSLRVEGNRQ